MSEASSLSATNTGSSSCWVKVVDSKWTDAALVTAFVALSIIGIAASTGAFNAIGTTNIAYGMCEGAALLLVAETVKLVCKYSSKNNHSGGSDNQGTSDWSSGHNLSTTEVGFDGSVPLSREPNLLEKTSKALVDKNHKPAIDPLKLISQYAHELNFSPEIQQNLKYVVKGIVDSQGWFAKNSETKENFNTLKRQFAKIFSLIEKKDDPQQTLLRNFLFELDSTYRDNSTPDDTAFTLCFAGLNRLLLNWIRILKRPETQEVETAIPFFFEDFKVHAIEMLILDQRELHVQTKSGDGEFLGFFESVKRRETLKRNYPSLCDLTQSGASSTLWAWPLDHLKELKTIFPMKPHETDEQYAKRASCLGQVPLEIMLWPMHDNNKISLAIELLRKPLKIPHTELAVHDKEILGLNDSSPVVKSLLNALSSYYFTQDLFVEYVKNWLDDASATQLKQKAFNYVWCISEADALFTPDKSNLSSEGVCFLIQSLQKAGHFDCSLFNN